MQTRGRTPGKHAVAVDELALLGKRQALEAEVIPETAPGIRQKAERERAITAMIRNGRLAEAFEIKCEDRTVELVAGGTEASAARIVIL